MVKANELRVGNLVHDNIGVLKIKGISTESDLTHIRLIPLSEKWLVKLGFEKNKKKVDIYEIGRLRLWIGSNGRCLAYLIEEDTTFGHYIPVPIEYVHQLQNLYFALTGQELETKGGNNG